MLSVEKTEFMIKYSLLFLLVILFGSGLQAIEPRSVSLSETGKVNWVYYDFNQKTELNPLTGFYLNGDGRIKYLRLSLAGSHLLLDQYGNSSQSIQGGYAVESNNDGKIQSIKQGYNELFDFQYDDSGRLVKIQDGSYNVKFRLVYSSEGRLEKLDEGDYTYRLQFTYDNYDRIDGVKDDKGDYSWRFDYNSNGALNRIKDNNYNQVIAVSYSSQLPQRVVKTNTTTTFFIGPINGNFLTGNFGAHNNNGVCGNDGYGNQTMVSFFKESNFEGKRLVYSIADFGSLPTDWDDEITSIQIPAGLTVSIYEFANFKGKNLVLKGNWTVSYATDFWNNRISSIRISYS